MTPLREWELYADPITVWYLDVFNKLERSRGHNDYIPLSEILICANNMDLIGTKNEFINVINAMDEIYVKHLRKKK